MQLKNFFQKKQIIFYLAILNIILLLIGTLIIGLESAHGGLRIVLGDISDAITNIKDDGTVDVPQYYFHSFWLMTFGLIFSGVAIFFMLFNLFKFKRISPNYQLEFWRIALFFILVGMVLTVAGESLYADKSIKMLPDKAKFKNVYHVGHFVGLIFCLTIISLPTFICGVVWYPDVKKSWSN